MISRRFSLMTLLSITLIVSQFVPHGTTASFAATSPCNAAGFIADVTIADGSIIQPGVVFTKTWRLKNTGTCTWTSSYGLIFVSGDQLDANTSITFPTVPPGQQADISIEMKAPTTPGHYRSYWMLKDAQGNKFGLGTSADKSFWIDINVPGTTTQTSTPDSQGAVLDFTRDMCTARWVSGAGQLSCPLADGDARGFVLSVDNPKLESGITDSAPGLLMAPQNKYNGYLQGFYPEMIVRPGDHFKASVGCAYGYSCYVTYRLDYQINNGAIKILWTWSEKNEGKIYQLDKDLSALSGQKVRFILTLLSAGSATNDRAIWGQPRIVRSGASTPTSTPVTPGPTTASPTATVPTPTVAAETLLDFATDACTANWKSGAGALPCPGTDADTRGFVLLQTNPKLENGAVDSASALILVPQNKYNGYIQGTYPEISIQKGDRFQGIVNCAHGYPCYVTFRLDYQIDNGLVYVFWSWKEKNEGQYYQVDKDLSALAGKKVKFTLTILASGSPIGDHALWSRPRIVRLGATPPTDTPNPQGKVTEAKASVKAPDFVNCAGTLKAQLLSSITTDGPTTVNYHWEISGATNQSTPESTLSFTSASMQTVTVNDYPMNCGTYNVRLVVTGPNTVSAESSTTLTIPPVLPVYDFNSFAVLGTMSCNEVNNYTWRQEPCNGESGGCWISQTPLFGNNFAGFLRHDGNTICNMNIP